MRKNRTPLLTTVLMFILCTTILVGATTAYFTENVQVTGNVVQSGNLKAGMDWTDSLVPDANGQISWIDAADEKVAENKIFNYSQWEPGFTAVRYIRIRNEGRLAFQYQLNILSSEAPKAGPNLMDVIDVYYGVVPDQVKQEDGTLFPSTHVKDYADFDAFTQALGLEKMGALSQLNANTGKTWGVMLPESGADLTLVPEKDRETAYIGSEQFCIVLHMQESAGNEYQKLDMGEGFQLQLNATQYTYESDSFGSDYDAEAKSELPTYAGPVTATASIADKVDSESKLMEAITLSSGDVSATVPEGAKVVANATSLTLRITPLTDSSADINLTDSEKTASYDVHVEGLAADNAVPVIVRMGEVLPKGLNMGNYGLYHVESNISNPMTLVDSVAALTAHNQFAYAPATGEVTVAMATFSEVAVVADTVNVWNGEVATSFAAGDGTETTPYIIANADQLAYMGERVSNDNTNYGSAYYKLISNINIGGVDNYKTNGRQVLFYPIGYNKVGGTTTDKGNWYTYGGSFKGIFDGNGHTITGIYQNTWAMVGDYSGTYYNDAMGLFGYVNGGTVKNLTIDSFYSEGEFAPTGCVTAYAAGNATFENIAITNSHPQTYNTGVAGIVGWDNGGDTGAEASNFTFKNITVDSTNTVSALWGSWDVGAAGLLGYLGEYSTAELNNCHVSATIDVYNDVCGNYQYYWYRYCGMLIGTVDKTKDDGSLDLSNITATNCTVNFGDRHEYYYCEFVKNSLASYTHDHQFSRIDHSELNFTDSNGNGRVDTNEVETVTGCTHDHASAGYESKDINGDGVVDSNMPLEDKQAVHIPFYQIFGGYGWGVNGYDIDTLPNLDINADQKGVEDNDIEDSSEKFATANTAKDTYTTGTTVSIGDLFTANSNATTAIDVDNVQVTVSPVNGSTAGGTYTANTTDWTQGRLTFSGLGQATITITDYYYCTPTTITVTVAEPASVDKFALVFENTDKYLYRVGNANAVALGALFTGTNNVVSNDVTVTVEAIDNTDVGLEKDSGANSDWTARTLDFYGTGPIKVTITDNNYCIPTELYLEVVNAKNTTTAASATANNVVLLNDISGTFTVSNGNTFYGNGFKITCSGNGSYGSKALSYGFITVSDGGILDNVQVICDIFPESYLYTGEMTADSSGKYPYAYSAIAITGNSTISNSYVYGARNNIFVGSGNITIENTVTECGSLANIQIKSSDAYTVTLDDVTTIQYQTTSSYNTSKTVLGFGVVVGDNESASNPTIKLTGDLKQYNWVTNADTAVSNTYAKTAITEALKVSDYQHTINNITTVNMGIAYLNGQTATCIDKRTNISTIPYKLSSISMSGQSGQVYSIAGSTITADSRYDASTDGIIPYTPKTNRPTLPTTIFSDRNDALDFTSGYDNEDARWQCQLSVDLDSIEGSSYTFNFSNLTLQKNGVTLAYDVMDSDGNSIDKSNGITLNQLFTGEYTLEVTDDQIYDALGNHSGTITHYLPLILNATKTSIDPPEFTNAKTATAIRLVTSSGGDWRPAYTVLTGVSVTYWSASESKVKTVDLSTLYNSGTISSNVWTYTCDDYTLTITGGAVHSDGSVITPVVANNTLYFASTNKAFGTSTTSRNIVLTYVFTDKNTSTTWNRTETVTYSELSEYDYNSFKNNGTLTEPSSSSCLTPDTLITLADGAQTRVDSLTGDEQLLVWNMETGALDSAPIMFIDNDAEAEYEVIHLYFSDGTDVKVIYEHGFWDYDLNRYVYLDENAAQYLGHSFFKRSGNGGEKVTLTSVVIETETTTAWSPVTADHLCYFVNGMLSMPGGVSGLFNIFDVDPATMTYDMEAMARDIETYGLFTYEELAEICPALTEKMFEAAGGAYLKVSIGKGNLTMDELVNMINRYAKFF